jgi:hypothetical protein
MARRAARRSVLAATLAAAAGATWAICVDPTDGPDIIVATLTGTQNWIQGSPASQRAYSFGTTSLNLGDTNVQWVAGTTAHPVIGLALYRLKTDVARPGGRFEQVGMSWLKHGFAALNQANPFCTCSMTGTQSFLRAGCTDPYDSGLNGDRDRLGPRYQVDASTGVFAYPYDDSAVVDDEGDRRVLVADSDVDPGQNTDARYFVEGHYIAADDAQAGNGLNNVSYRETFVVNSSSRNLGFDGGIPTVQELPALAAWPAIDPEVELQAIDTQHSPVQRFHVARKVHDLGSGAWRHEILVHNLNSDLSARRLTVRFPGGAVISDPGFHDVDHHSGEPFSTSDWTIDNAVADQVTWSTSTHAFDANANALRWGTSFNFWFDATADGAGVFYEIETFKPGCPKQLLFTIPDQVLFADDFECGATGSWSLTGS